MKKALFIIYFILFSTLSYARTGVVLQDATGNVTGTSSNPLKVLCISGCGAGDVASGGTGFTSWADDTVGIGAGGEQYQQKTIPDCDDSSGQHLNYDTTANSFTCGTTSSGGIVGSDTQFIFNDGGSTFAGSSVLKTDKTINASSGTEQSISITNTVAQSGTAGYYSLYVNTTESSTGSGAKYLMALALGGSLKAYIDNAGAMYATSYATNSTSAGSLQLNEASANGANFIKFSSASSRSSDATITLDGTDGTTITLPAASGTLRNLAPRTNTVASSATPSINVDTTDIFTITALATAITSMSSGLSGTPVNGQKLTIRILDNGTARAITWGASFASRGSTLPTTTILSKYLYVGFIYNSTASVWDCVAVSQEQ